MQWKFVSDLLFHDVFTNDNLQADNEMKWINRKSKNTVKNSWDCIEIFTCDCGGGIVAYYCVCMCKWCIEYVYVKVHAQHDL